MKPSKTLERELREAIVRSLHKLVPEFRAHMHPCPACDEFHDWVRWRHVQGTTKWVTNCPVTGQALRLPFLMGE